MPPSFVDTRQRTKHSSEGLRFVVRAGLIYKTKTPLIWCQLVTNKAFKRGSSFCSSSRPYLQNEDPTDFASADNEQIKHLSEGLRFVVRGRSYLQNEDPIDFASFGV